MNSTLTLAVWAQLQISGSSLLLALLFQLLIQQMGFADIVFKVWNYCLPSEHDFLVLLFKVLLDKLDSEAYR